MIIESPLLGVADNLRVRARDSAALFFTGLHEAERVKMMIQLSQAHRKSPQSSFGFKPSATGPIEWKDLPDPATLVSATLSVGVSTILQTMESREPMQSLLVALGNLNVQMSEWIPRNGYRERTVAYNKVIVVPVLGKNVVQVIETQRLFEGDGTFAIDVRSDLGKTPYCEFFDPRCQLVFVGRGGETEFAVKFEILWSGQPFVKGIIEQKTVAEARAQWQRFLAKLNEEYESVSPAVEASGKEKDEEAEKDTFAKARRIYKIIIIALMVVLLFCFWLKYGRKRGLRPTTPGWATLCVIILFFAFLFFL
jgi:hypothetical protein